MDEAITYETVGRDHRRTGLMDVKEAARFLHIGRSTLLKMAYAQQVPSLTIGARRLFPLREIEEWIAANVRQHLVNCGEFEEEEIPALTASGYWEELGRGGSYQT